MRPDARIGQQIRLARRRAGLSLSQAGGSRLSRPHLSLVERGLRGISADRLLYLADRLQVGLSFLLTEGAHPEYFERLLEAAEDRSRAGEWSKAVAILRGLLPAIPGEAASWVARASTWLGLALAHLRRYEFATPYLTEGLRSAQESADPHLIAQSHNAIGLLHLDLHEYALALDQFERGLTVLRRHPRPRAALSLTLRANAGLALRRLGRLEESMSSLSEAARIAAPLGDHAQLGKILRIAAGALMEMRAHDAARARLEDARAHFEAAERLDLVAAAENGLGLLCLDTGDFEKAAHHLRRSVALCDRIADDRGRAQSLTELARAHAALGRYDEAMPAADEAIRLSAKVSDEVEAARAEAVRGEILIARGRLAEAEAAFACAIPVLEARELWRELSRVYSSLGSALQAGGRYADACDALSRAIALAEMQARPGQTRSRL